ncbi:MAG TPA: hypothetical protein VGE43_15590, partial [Acidimicrobiales bacterium]
MFRSAASLLAKKTAIVAITGVTVIGGATLALAAGEDAEPAPTETVQAQSTTEGTTSTPCPEADDGATDDGSTEATAGDDDSVTEDAGTDDGTDDASAGDAGSVDPTAALVTEAAAACGEDD